MSKARKKRKPRTPAKFRTGDRVRVRQGVIDADHPDIPLGGWAGRIDRPHGRGKYTVRFSRETLSRVHPICKRRCIIEGTAFAERCLHDADLEPDPGGPVVIEQPAAIAPRPLSERRRDDRVRRVFALTSDDYLPEVDEDSLETYYEYLDQRLVTPFEARDETSQFVIEGVRNVTTSSGSSRPVVFVAPSPEKIVRVAGLDREVGWCEDEGILCTIRTAEGVEIAPLARLKPDRRELNSRLIDDYCAWFFGFLDANEDDLDDDLNDDPDDEPDDEPRNAEADPATAETFEEPTWGGLARVAVELLAFAALYGAVMGAAVAAMPWARWSAAIGFAFWGIVMAYATAFPDKKDPHAVVPKGFVEGVFAALTGFTVGAVQGAFFAVAVVAFVGAIVGLVAGRLCRWVLRPRNSPAFHIFPGLPLVGAAVGAAAQALYLNRPAAEQGFFDGMWIGVIAALGICVVLFLLSMFIRIGRLGIPEG